MIRTIFFDFDGVIVESVDIKTKAFYRLFEAEGENVARQVVDYHLKNTGISRYDKFRYIYREILNRPLDEEQFSALCNKFAGLVIDNVVKAPYVKGAKKFLEDYSAGYRCFVVSATPQEEIEEIVQKRGISHFFAGIYGAPTIKSRAVKDIIIAERVSSTDALYIGDALSDYNAAKDNSVHFIARIYGNESIFAGLNCLKVKDLTNLKEIIDTNQYIF